MAMRCKSASSVAVTYKPPMLVPRVRLPAGALFLIKGVETKVMRFFFFFFTFWQRTIKKKCIKKRYENKKRKNYSKKENNRRQDKKEKKNKKTKTQYTVKAWLNTQ